jgi:anti-anti-sigma regulatory factor
MPFEIQTSEQGLLLELTGSLTARHAAELGQSLRSGLKTGETLQVRAGRLDDIDTSILQMLVSLRKTAATFVLLEYSEAFGGAVDRCALRRELLSKEPL